jgi:hypothetical protein
MRWLTSSATSACCCALTPWLAIDSGAPGVSSLSSGRPSFHSVSQAASSSAVAVPWPKATPAAVSAAAPEATRSAMVLPEMEVLFAGVGADVIVGSLATLQAACWRCNSCSVRR